MIIPIRYSGTPLPRMHGSCPRGEELTISLTCVDSLGAPMDLSGISAVLGWDTSPATAQSRHEVAGDATGRVSFSFTPSETFAMSFWQTFDIWLEASLSSREEIIEPSFVNITNTIAPVTATYYYGVGAAGLNAASLALLPSLQAASPIRSPILLSPNAQKCYFVSPAAHANYSVYLSGYLVPLIADRAEVVNGILCRVKETLSLGTWTNAPFETRAAPDADTLVSPGPWRYYYGAGPAGLTSRAQIEALSYVDLSAQTVPFTTTSTLGQYLYFAFPTALGTAVLTADQYVVLQAATVQTTAIDDDGVVRAYTICRTSSAVIAGSHSLVAEVTDA